jgi:hypothetical protein
MQHLLSCVMQVPLDSALYFTAPYELLATQLQSFIMSYSFDNLSYAMRIQLKFETAMPSMSVYRDCYNILTSSYYYLLLGKKYGSVSLGTGIVATLIYKSSMTIAVVGVPSTAMALHVA